MTGMKYFGCIDHVIVFKYAWTLHKIHQKAR